MIRTFARGATAGLFLLLSFAGACGHPRPDPYEIYNLVLQGYPGRRTPVVVCRSTNLPIFSKESRRVGEAFPEDAWQLSERAGSRLQEVFPELALSTLKYFEKDNRGPSGILPELINTPGVTVASVSCRDELRSSHASQPVELSGVGFSDDGEQALVYLGVLDPQTGRGWYILLERNEAGWHGARRIQAWVA
jgi:hypothetical protein